MLPIPRDDETWHAIRARHVGASEVSALFGVQPDYALGLFALWQVKAGRMPRPHVGNARTRAGLALEEGIALLAAEQESWNIQPGQYASHASGLGATLDRIIAAPGANDTGMTGPGVLELKNVDWLVHRRSWQDGEPPIHILLQLQAQLAATGYGWGAVASLVGGNDLRVYRYTARPKLIADMVRRTAEFWESIKAGQIPNADGSDSAWRALVATTDLPDDDEPADLLDDVEANAWAQDWLTHAAVAKAAETKRDAAKNLLVQRIGSARRAVGEGWRVSLSDVAEKPPTIITEAMIGQTIPGRAGSRRASIREAT